MWRFVTRGLRERIERHACRTNVYSQSQHSQDGNVKSEVKASLTCRYKFVLPNISAFTNNFGYSTKDKATEDSQYQSKWNPKHTWTEAVGWSSALAIGWVVCQSLCLHRRCLDNEPKKCLHTKLLHVSEKHVSDLLNQLSKLYSKNVLPTTNCISNNDNNEQILNDEKQYSGIEKSYGPITADEAFKEAAEDFIHTHNLIMGEFELQFGIKALEEERYKDAIKHFTVGAELFSPGSTFNLGLCYELGLGTLIDQIKAAKYYSDAANLGHADAMYNIGVFHARGQGGLPLDPDMARTYFIKAAKLGQTHAKHALDLEKIRYSLEEHNTCIRSGNTNYTANTLDSENRNHPCLELQHCNTTMDASVETVNEILKNENYNHELQEARNTTDILLKYLGFKKPSRTALKLASNISRTSY